MTDEPRGMKNDEPSDGSPPPLSDENLMAYADGELDEAMAATVERSIFEDGALAVRIVGFLRSRRLARVALSDLPEETAQSVPPALREAVARAASARPRTGREDGTSRRSKEHRRWPPWVVPVAVAASVALGLAGYWRVVENAAQTGRGPLAVLDDGRMSTVLARLPTGQEETIDGKRVRAVGTYRLANGSICRDLVVESKPESSEVILCQAGPSLAWTLRVAVVAPSEADSYSPAAARDVVDSYLERQGAGSPATGAEERAVLPGLRP